MIDDMNPTVEAFIKILQGCDPKLNIHAQIDGKLDLINISTIGNGKTYSGEEVIVFGVDLEGVLKSLFDSDKEDKTCQ